MYQRVSYLKKDSIEIHGKFICDFRNYCNQIISINDLDRSFIFSINSVNIINTNLSITIKSLIDIKDWLEVPISSKGKTKKQIGKLSDTFLKPYIRNKKLTSDFKKSLKDLHERGFYQGNLIDSYSMLLDKPYEILVKAIFNMGRKNNINHLFPTLFKKHVSEKSAVIKFEANDVQNKKKGVYFFTLNDTIVYVGKSSNFQVEYNGYRSARFINSFPNNNGTRGRINMKIAEKVKDQKKSIDIKWFNMSIDKTNINSIFTKLEENGVDLENSFKRKNPKLDFFETLIMSLITSEKWNDDNGGFRKLIEINSKIF